MRAALLCVLGVGCGQAAIEPSPGLDAPTHEPLPPPAVTGLGDTCFELPSYTCLWQLQDTKVRLVVIDVDLLASPIADVQTDFITGSNFTGENPSQSSLQREFAPEGVVFAQIFVGTNSPNLVTTWVTEHDAQSVLEMVDPAHDGLASLGETAAVPLHLYVDVPSMTIIAADVGGWLSAATIQSLLSR